MKELLKIEDEVVKVNFSFTVKQSKEKVWSYLTTNNGLKQWFPEIHVGNVAEQGYFRFVTEDLDVKMNIIEFDQFNSLSFEWDSGKVSFSIEEKSGHTLISFYEELPPEFPQKYRDIAGWRTVLSRLHDALIGNDVSFDNSKVIENGIYYQKLLEQVK